MKYTELLPLAENTNDDVATSEKSRCKAEVAQAGEALINILHSSTVHHEKSDSGSLIYAVQRRSCSSSATLDLSQCLLTHHNLATCGRELEMPSCSHSRRTANPLTGKSVAHPHPHLQEN